MYAVSGVLRSEIIGQRICVFIILIVKVAQSCPAVCDPMDSATPWILHGILQVRILEWVAFPFSRGSSRPRNRTRVSCIAVDFLPTELSGNVAQVLSTEAVPVYISLSNVCCCLHAVLSMICLTPRKAPVNPHKVSSHPTLFYLVIPSQFINLLIVVIHILPLNIPQFWQIKKYFS